MKRAMVTEKIDNVATVLDDIKKGDRLGIYDLHNNIIDELIAVEDIPYGNKLALNDISVGNQVIKYGEVIGVVYKDIKKYQLVHVHNIKSNNIDLPDSVKAEILRKMNLVEV